MNKKSLLIADRVKIRFSLSKKITKWERDFLESLLWLDGVSNKQLDKISEIYDKYRFGLNPFNRSTSIQKNHKLRSHFIYTPHIGEWGDYHDFDRD